ncbi:hypothetical protein ACQ4PT_058130 [Festuca glaucescens]
MSGGAALHADHPIPVSSWSWLSRRMRYLWADPTTRDGPSVSSLIASTPRSSVITPPPPPPPSAPPSSSSSSPSSTSPSSSSSSTSPFEAFSSPTASPRSPAALFRCAWRPGGRRTFAEVVALRPRHMAGAQPPPRGNATLQLPRLQLLGPTAWLMRRPGRPALLFVPARPQQFAPSPSLGPAQLPGDVAFGQHNQGARGGSRPPMAQFGAGQFVQPGFSSSPYQHLAPGYSANQYQQQPGYTNAPMMPHPAQVTSGANAQRQKRKKKKAQQPHGLIPQQQSSPFQPNVQVVSQSQGAVQVQGQFQTQLQQPQQPVFATQQHMGQTLQEDLMDTSDGDGDDGKGKDHEDLMDTSESMHGPADTVMQQAQETNTTTLAPSGSAHTASLVHAVTPFNSDPKTPRGIELVAAMRVSHPELERRPAPLSPSSPSPRVSPTALQAELAAASTLQQPADRTPTSPQMDRREHGLEPTKAAPKVARCRSNTLGRCGGGPSWAAGCVWGRDEAGSGHVAAFSDARACFPVRVSSQGSYAKLCNVDDACWFAGYHCNNGADDTTLSAVYRANFAARVAYGCCTLVIAGFCFTFDDISLCLDTNAFGFARHGFARDYANNCGSWGSANSSLTLPSCHTC